MFRKFNPAILANNPWGDPPGGSSGGNGSGGGWGRGPRRSSGGDHGSGDPGMPPDLEEIFRRSRQNFNRAVPPEFMGKNGLWIAGVGLFVLWCLSGIYSVSGGEQGVVLRFGKLERTTPPGLHMHLPYPIETVLKPNVGIVNQIDVGINSGAPMGRDNRTISPDGQMLTQDKNILNMHFRIMWRIDDAAKYLFNLRDPEGTIRAAGESVMRELVGQRTFDAIVRGGREELGLKAKENLQDILNTYQAGVLIVDVLPQKIDPPSEVIDAFNDVQRAEQDAEKEINQAEAYKSDVVPRARGEAEKIKLDAMAYREQAKREAEGEAERFLSVYNIYRNSSDLTTKRMYIETMQEIIKNSSKVYVDGKSSGNVLPFLPLGDLMNKNNRNNNNDAVNSSATNNSEAQK